MHSHMIYGISVWGGARISYSNKIQQGFLRLFPGNNSYKLIRINYNILNFRSIGKYFTCIKFYESHINKNHPCKPQYLMTAHQVMNTQLGSVISNNSGLQLLYCRTVLLQKSFLYRPILLWNGLSVLIKQANTLSIFKNQLKTHLLAEQD